MTMTTHCRQLNDGWNAEPNAPDPAVRVEHGDVVLRGPSDSPGANG